MKLIDIEAYMKVAANIGSAINGLLQAQELLVNLMGEQANIPDHMKKQIIEDMNKTIGIQKINSEL